MRGRLVCLGVVRAALAAGVCCGMAGAQQLASLPMAPSAVLAMRQGAVAAAPQISQLPIWSKSANFPVLNSSRCNP